MRSEYPVIVMSRTPGYMRGACESTTAFAGEPAHDAFEAARVLFVEASALLRIDVEYRDERAMRVHHRNDDLRLGTSVTADVTRELGHVRDDDRASFRCGGATNAAAECNLQAAQRPLVRAHSKQV